MKTIRLVYADVRSLGNIDFDAAAYSNHLTGRNRLIIYRGNYKDRDENPAAEVVALS